MAIAITRMPAIGTDTTIQTHARQRTNILSGYLNCSGASTYAAGGVTVTFPMHNVGYVAFENLWGNSGSVTASSMNFQYDRTNTKLMMFQFTGPSTTSSVCLQTELASDSVITGLTAIYFFAIGSD